MAHCVDVETGENNTEVGIERKTEPEVQVFKDKGVFRWSVDNSNKEKVQVHES